MKNVITNIILVSLCSMNLAASWSNMLSRTTTQVVQQKVPLYQLLKNVSSTTQAVCPQINLIKQPLSQMQRAISHQKMYNIVLQTLAKDKSQLQAIINTQARKQGIHVPTTLALQTTLKIYSKNIGSYLYQNFNLTKYFTSSKKSLYQDLLELSQHTQAITPAVWPLKQVLTKLEQTIGNKALYQKTLYRLSTDKKGQLQKLIDQQVARNITAHERALEKGFKHSAHWNKQYQEATSHLYTSQPTTTSKALTTNQSLSTVTTQHHAVITPSPSNTIIYPNEVEILPPVNPIQPYNEINTLYDHEVYAIDKSPGILSRQAYQNPTRLSAGLYLAASTKSLPGSGSYLTTQVKFKGLSKSLKSSQIESLPYNHHAVINQAAVPATQSIHPSNVELLPATHTLDSYKQMTNLYDYEVFIADTLPHYVHPQLQLNEPTKLLTTKLPLHCIEPQITQNIVDAPIAAQQTKLLGEPTRLLTEPTKLLTENKLANLSYHQVQNATYNQAAQAKNIVDAPIASQQTKLLGEPTRLLTESTKLLTENKLANLNYQQVQNAAHNQAAQAKNIVDAPIASQQMKLLGEPTKLLTESTKLLTESTKLLTENKLANLNYHQVQNATHNQAAQAKNIVDAPIAAQQMKLLGEPTRLLTESTKLLTENKLANLSYHQVQNAAYNQAVHAKNIVEAPIASQQTKLLAEPTRLLTESTKLLTENKLANVNYHQVQNALHHEAKQAIMLLNSLKDKPTGLTTGYDIIIKPTTSAPTIDGINPHDIEILPPVNPIQPYNKINTLYDYEVYFADTLPHYHKPTLHLPQPTPLISANTGITHTNFISPEDIEILPPLISPKAEQTPYEYIVTPLEPQTSKFPWATITGISAGTGALWHHWMNNEQEIAPSSKKLSLLIPALATTGAGAATGLYAYLNKDNHDTSPDDKKDKNNDAQDEQQAQSVKTVQTTQRSKSLKTEAEQRTSLAKPIIASMLGGFTGTWLYKLASEYIDNKPASSNK